MKHLLLLFSLIAVNCLAYTPQQAASIKSKVSVALKQTSISYKVNSKELIRLKNEEGKPYTYTPGKGADPILVVYDDFGQPAAGWGNSRPYWRIGDTLSVAEVNKALAEDVAAVEQRTNAIIASLPWRGNWNSPLLRPMYYALFDLTYRAGKTNVMHSEYVARLRRVRVNDPIHCFEDLRFAASAITSVHLLPAAKASSLQARNKRLYDTCNKALQP